MGQASMTLPPPALPRRSGRSVQDVVNDKRKETDVKRIKAKILEKVREKCGPCVVLGGEEVWGGW